MDLDKTQLQESLHLLNLIYHRNHNQHRHQKWWKWLGIFRRHMKVIVGLLEAEEQRRRDLLRGARPDGTEKEKDRVRLADSIGWMNRVGVERCWL